MTRATRRGFLKGSAALSSTAFLSTLEALNLRQAQAAIGRAQPVASPYGPISPVADEATGLPLLQLPEGFACRSYGWTGDPMDNGAPTPDSHDGMAVIHAEPRGRDVDVVLVRNHERSTTNSVIGAPAMYDTVMLGNGMRAGGGTTNLVFRGRKFVGSYPSLGGTLTNCAGGPTPWGTWLSCEETGADLTAQGGRKHGYVFEVRREANATTGTPIIDMGRFPHEAVAVDPATRFAYLTEDARNASGFYRFIPNDASGRPGAYERGGRLQFAKVKGVHQADLIVANQGSTFELEWIDIAQPDADRVTVNTAAGGSPLPDYGNNSTVSGPFWQGWTAGGLRMSRGEGIWYSNGRVYVVDTSTGTDASKRRGRGEGAVWEFDPRTNRLRALFVSIAQLALDNPDNITVSPRGGILLCEDGDSALDPFGEGSRLMGLTPDGNSYIFAKNNLVLGAAQLAAAGKFVAAGDYRGIEFAGACFDPSGKVLFVNIQTPGLTLAIWGPWARGAL